MVKVSSEKEGRRGKKILHLRK